MSTNKENVKLATTAALECASQTGVKSLALPGLGTGVRGLNLEEAAEAMVTKIKRHIESGSPLKNIILVGFSNDLTQTFERSVDKNIPKPSLRSKQSIYRMNLHSLK